MQWNKLAAPVQAKYVKLRLLNPVVDGHYTRIVEFEVDNSDKTGAQSATRRLLLLKVSIGLKGNLREEGCLFSFTPQHPYT